MSAINIEAECCFDPKNKKNKHIILLGTLVSSSNFLLEFYRLSVSCYLLVMPIIMSIVIVIVKGNANSYHIWILFTPQPCRYVN